jgi:hypothetical protein
MEPPEHVHLYDVSIDTLGLSDEAAAACQKSGISTVGDVIDYLNRGNDAMRPPAIVDNPEVKQHIRESIIASGYGRFLYGVD